MSTTAPTNSAIVTDYKARTPGSGALFERARKVLPSGITHDARYLDPYSIHVAKAKGPRKWDVDGNEYVDYFGGHGAMLLGHSHPAVIEAVKRQMDLGTHYGSSHELEVRWAELVCELTPCAEKVRFTASGTEASHSSPATELLHSVVPDINTGQAAGPSDTLLAPATSTDAPVEVPGSDGLAKPRFRVIPGTRPQNCCNRPRRARKNDRAHRLGSVQNPVEGRGTTRSGVGQRFCTTCSGTVQGLSFSKKS